MLVTVLIKLIIIFVQIKLIIILQSLHSYKVSAVFSIQGLKVCDELHLY